MINKYICVHKHKQDSLTHSIKKISYWLTMAKYLSLSHSPLSLHLSLTLLLLLHLFWQSCRLYPVRNRVQADVGLVAEACHNRVNRARRERLTLRSSKRERERAEPSQAAQQLNNAVPRRSMRITSDRYWLLSIFFLCVCVCSLRLPWLPAIRNR